MREYIVVFVVQADSLQEAMYQAEMYLNTGDRMVDCNVSCSPTVVFNLDLPEPAPKIGAVK